MFKVGDKVQVIQQCNSKMPFGSVHIVYMHQGCLAISPNGEGGDSVCTCPSLWKLTTTNLIMPNLKQSFKNLFIGEPEASERKVGVKDDTGSLTTEGTQVFLEWLYATNRDKFNKEVVEKLKAEQEKETK